MGEAKRRRESGGSAAPGTLRIEANGVPQFDWSGTEVEAERLQQQFLKAMEANGIKPLSYANRVACYAMAFGMPEAGAPDRRSDAKFGDVWSTAEANVSANALV